MIFAPSGSACRISTRQPADAPVLEVRGAVPAEILRAGRVDHRDDRRACTADVRAEGAELVAHAENAVVMVDQAGAVRLVDARSCTATRRFCRSPENSEAVISAEREKVVDRVLAGVRRGQHAARLLGLELKRRDHDRKADLFRKLARSRCRRAAPPSRRRRGRPRSRGSCCRGALRSAPRG